jgi:cytidylate kinase
MELSAKGEIVDLGKVKEEMALRDKQDSERPIAPLKQAQDAVVVDTSTMSIDSVLDQLESLVRERS